MTIVGWTYLTVCCVSAAAIGYDIAFNRRRQPMGVMNVVYPVTALYLGPVALAFYRRWARAAPPVSDERTAGGLAEIEEAPMPEMAVAATYGMMHRHDRRDMSLGIDPTPPHVPANRVAPQKPRWVSMAIEVSHCGSGCTLGDVTAEWVIYALALTIAGRVLFAEYIGDYALALAFGIVFQYFAIAPMRTRSCANGRPACSPSA